MVVYSDIVKVLILPQNEVSIKLEQQKKNLPEGNFYFCFIKHLELPRQEVGGTQLVPEE